MKLKIDITISPETLSNNGAQITDPRDLNKATDNVSLNLSGYYYPGGIASLTKALTEWVEVHKDLDSLVITPEQKAKALEDYLKQNTD